MLLDVNQGILELVEIGYLPAAPWHCGSLNFRPQRLFMVAAIMRRHTWSGGGMALPLVVLGAWIVAGCLAAWLVGGACRLGVSMEEDQPMARLADSGVQPTHELHDATSVGGGTPTTSHRESRTAVTGSGETRVGRLLR